VVSAEGFQWNMSYRMDCGGDKNQRMQGGSKKRRTDVERQANF
jgi:hypothetical protein